MLVIPLAWRLAPKMGMVDMPDPRKVHKAPIPRIGGWGIVLGALVPILIVARLDPLMQSFVIGGLTMFLYGVWDDAKQLSHWPKFAGQIFTVGLVVYYGNLWVSRFPFLEPEALPAWIGKPFTMFAMIGAINAVNHSDGLDGLAGGETLLSLIAIAFLSYLVDDDVSVAIAFATMGGILGFLRYNTHPAQVFMGDAGSQFLGFTLAFLVVYLTQVGHSAVSPALSLLLIGLPLADIVVVLFLRIRGGMNWFRATRNHIHHRLLDRGFDHYETVVIIYSLQAILVTSAVFLRYYSDLVVMLMYFGVVCGLFALLVTAEQRQWKARTLEEDSPLARLVDKLRGNPWTVRAPRAAISTLIPLFVVVGACWINAVPRDFGVISGVIFAAVVVDFFTHKQGAISPITRGASYVTAVFVAYLIINHPGVSGPVSDTWIMSFIIVLALLVALCIRFTAKSQFGTTPTDYLIVFGVLALVFFGNLDVEARETSQLVMYAIVLLYGCELVIAQMRDRWNAFSFATAIALGVLAYRGILVV